MSGNRKKVGLVLSAGASRGFAHIGVLQAFLEQGIPIDVLTGTSMGALIGGVYATGVPLSYIREFAMHVDIHRFLDFSVKEGGIVRGKKVEELLRILTANKSIEQLDIPYACAAIDLVNGKVRMFTEGGLYEAIRASISMPGIFAPYIIDGRHYIDGGTLAHMPIEAAKALGAEVVIAVDVSWRGQDMEVPKNAVGVLQSALHFATWHIVQEQQKGADLLIAPEVFDINPFSAKECAFCIEQGKAAAQAQMEQIKALIWGRQTQQEGENGDDR